MSATQRGSEASTEGATRATTKGERTRRRILLAARRIFAEVGYERATIRAIAAAAEVDKSSVNQHFGSKRELFHAAVHWRIPLGDLVTADAGTTAGNLLRGMLTAWAADPDSPMAVLLRASMTSEDAAQLLRDRITGEAVDPLAATIEGPDARLRAGLFAAMMMGIASHRHLLDMPDVADADLDDVLRIATPLLESLISPDRQGS